MICQKQLSIQVVASLGCSGLPQLPADGAWIQTFLSPGCTYTFDGAAGAAALVSTAAVSTSGARETDVCNSGAPYTYTIDLDYSIVGAPFSFPPIFEPRLVLTITVNAVVIDTDTSPILGAGSMGSLAVSAVIPADSNPKNIIISITWDALANNPPPTTTANCTLTGTVS